MDIRAKLPTTMLLRKRSGLAEVDWNEGLQTAKPRAETYISNTGTLNEKVARPILEKKLGLTRVKFQSHRRGGGLDFTGYLGKVKIAGDIKDFGHPRLTPHQIMRAEQMGRNYWVVFFTGGQYIGWVRYTDWPWEPTGDMQPALGIVHDIRRRRPSRSV